MVMEPTEVLTFDEIKKRYAPEWVLIGNPQTDGYEQVLAGTVLFHSPNREEVYQKSIELDLDRCAFRFLGTFPEDMVFVL
jgi:hypothetical protein